MKDLSFSFRVYARALAARIIEHKGAQNFVIGVAGPWGCGKTTLMDAAIAELGGQHITFNFNAWAHSKQDVVWRSFFIALVSALQKELNSKYPANDKGKRLKEGEEIERVLNETEQALYTAFTRETPGQIEIDVGNIAKTGAKLALKFVPWGDALSGVTNLLFNDKKSAHGNTNSGDDALNESDVNDLCGILKRSVIRQQVAKIESLEQFHCAMQNILNRFLSSERKLVVAIDDVDRCLPEQGLEVFEAIKLFLDIPNTVFLVAMDQGILQHALDLRYKQNSGDSRRITAEIYAEKMIDLFFPIPTPSVSSFKNYVMTELPLAHMLTNCFSLICAGIPFNPRTWARFSNRAALRNEIIKILYGGNIVQFENHDGQAAFLKLEVLWFRWPQVMRLLGSFQNFLYLEDAVFEAKPESDDFRNRVKKTKDVELVLTQQTTNDITRLGDVAGSLNDLALVQFIGKEPQLSKQKESHEHLETLFVLDRQEVLNTSP